MRNPFVAMAIVAAAIRSASAEAFRRAVQGSHIVPGIREPRYLKHGPTVAQVKRAAIKAKNRAKHRRACRGSA